VGVGGRAPRGSGSRAPSVWQFLQIFNENNPFLGMFRLKFLLKNIFLISSIILYKTVNDLKTEHFSRNKNYNEK